jgi:polar amino acid transport system permease protein
MVLSATIDGCGHVVVGGSGLPIADLWSPVASTIVPGGAGSTPAAPLQLADWAFVWANRQFLAAGAALTILLTLTSVLVGVAIGIPAGFLEAYGEGRLARAASQAGVLLRGTPLLVILAFTFFVLPLPVPASRVSLFGSEFGIDAFVAATLGLGLRSAAYQAQIVRGAIQSVAPGQMEAARGVGLSTSEAIRHVIAPQALRRTIPGFQNEYTIVLKDTSVAFFIGLAELLTTGFNLFVQQSTAVFEVIIAVSVVYFLLTFLVNRGLDRLDARLAIPGEGGA